MDVISARFDGKSLSHGRVVPAPPEKGVMRTVREGVQICLGLAFSSNLNAGIANFSEWDTLTVSQDGVEVDLAAALSTLRRDLPLVCIFGHKDKSSSMALAQLLTQQYEQQIADRRADDLARRVAQTLRGDMATHMTGVVPVTQERHWLIPDVVVALKRFFHRASTKISDRLKANPRFPEEGLTSELVYTALTERDSVGFVSDLLRATGVRLTLSCAESGSAERLLGSDIGFCLSVNGPGLHLRRSILCQAKRLHPDGAEFSSRSRYGDLLDSHGLEQAKKMLDITPCSYFLLYNPPDVGAIVGHASPTLEVKASLDYCDDGVLVLPASFVIGASRREFQPVAHLAPFTCSFVKFMVDDFIQGKLGDSSKTAACAALTREMRGALDIPNMEVPPPRFSVTFGLEVPEVHGQTIG